MTITHTYTRTHAEICSECRQKVDYWWEDGPPVNFPCEHRADYQNLCPSWGPVDGCQCQAHLGHVPHPPAA